MKTPLLVRIVRTRPRLFTSLAIGVLVSAALALLTDWRLATRLLVAWDIFVALYLALAAHLMSRSDVDRIRDRAATEDEGQLAILVLTVVAALASLGAIFPEPGTGPRRRPRRRVLRLQRRAPRPDGQHRRERDLAGEAARPRGARLAAERREGLD